MIPKIIDALATATPRAMSSDDAAACENCLYWNNSVSSIMEPESTGRCLRRAPGFDDRTGLAVWPFTEDGDWCGEYVKRPNCPAQHRASEVSDRD